MEKVEESMSCYDLAIEIDNNYLHAKLNKGLESKVFRNFSN